MEPAPSPSGIANKKKKTALSVKANPSNAAAVIKVLTAETTPVPNLLITFELIRLEIIVQALTVAEIYPASETGKLNSR